MNINFCASEINLKKDLTKVLKNNMKIYRKNPSKQRRRG